MIRFRRFLPLVAVLVGAAILGAPTQAHAAFKIYLQEAGVNGGAITQVATGPDFTPIAFTGTYGHFSVTLFGASSDNDATLSDLLSSTTKVKNTNGSTRTLTLWVSQTNYSLPAGSPLVIESGLGGSFVTKTKLGLTGIFQAYADSGNSLLGIADYTNGPQDATAIGTTIATGSASGLFFRSGDYSLTSKVVFTISAGGQANYSDHINVTATPAPAGVVLALTGLPFLGIGTWLRRRKVKMQNS